LEEERRISDREWAVVWCASLGPDARAAHPAILAACRDLDSSVRAAAVKSLARIEVRPDQAIPLLSQILLQDCSGSVRGWAAFSLGLYGDNAEAAIPALRQATSDPYWLVPSRAREALKQIETAMAGKEKTKQAVSTAL